VIVTGSIARAASAKEWAAAIAAGLFVSLAVLAAGWLFAKGAYWAFALVLIMALAAVLASRRLAREPRVDGLALAASLALPVAAAQMANHWGGTAALVDSMLALMFIAALAGWNIYARHPVLPTAPGRQASLLAGLLALAAITAVFGGGAYIGDRFSTSRQDFAGRQEHWRAGLNLLNSPDDWLLGKGLGRFPASFFFGAPGNEFPGTYRLNQEANNTFLSLSGPHYQAGFGQTLHISQRIRLGPPSRYHVELDGRAQSKTMLALAICTKHLLYPEACAGKRFDLLQRIRDGTIGHSNWMGRIWWVAHGTRLS